jgi:hypothetical protein
MPTTTIRLIDEAGALYFPTGHHDHGGPTILLRSYPAGDWDHCPWPMTACRVSELELRERLARALYDERETNDTFPTDAVIELPDGATFDFDAELVAADDLEDRAAAEHAGFGLVPTDGLQRLMDEGFQLLPQPMDALRDLLAWLDEHDLLGEATVAGSMRDTGPLDRARALVEAEAAGNLIG